MAGIRTDVADAPPAVEAASAGRGERSSLLPHLALLATIVVWSSHATVIKVGLHYIGPLAFTSFRFLAGGAVLLAIALATRQPVWRRPPLRLLVAATLFGLVINPLGFTVGVRYSTAVDVSVIMGLTPVATAVLLFATARRPLPARRLAGVVLGFAGLIAVVAASAHRSGSGTALVGDVVALASPTCWAAYILVTARAARDSSAVVFLTWSMLLSQAVLLPLAVAESAARPEAWLPALPWLAFSAIVATGAGYAVYFWALNRVGVTETAVYTYLQPLLGALMGAFFLGEPFGPWQIGGAVAIVAAAYLGSWSRVETGA